MDDMYLKTLAAAASLTASITVLAVLPSSALAQHQHGMGHPQAGDGTAPIAQKAGEAIEISVTSEGFVPDKIKVRAGQKARLVVTRRTDRTCATEIVIKDQGINQKLPLNQPVTVEFTPRKSGQLRYACGMDMISGVIVVE
jgi:plastocyanin domain-containing protein